MIWKTRTGRDLVDSVIGKFEGMVSDLDRGLAQIHAEAASREAAIEAMVADHSALLAKAETAAKVRGKIAALIA